MKSSHSYCGTTGLCPGTTWAAIMGLALLVSLLAAPCAWSGTVVSGEVNGFWDLPGSPYWVEGDLLLLSDSTLTIQSGVEVRFRGPYRFLVNGNLQAEGTELDSIIFTWDEPQAAMEWRGIRLVEAADGTLLEYCRIEHARSAEIYPDVRGGGIYCQACSLVTIRHCLLQHNISHNDNWNGLGAGVACVDAYALIEHCVIRNNQADSGGGIAAMDDGVATIRNNLISGNIAFYSGGGIYVGAWSTPAIENNIIKDNAADGWGGGGITLWNCNTLSQRMVSNNIVVGNWTSAVGGGLYIRYECSIYENNTIADNTAETAGGGIYVLNQGGDECPQILNGIIWGNVAPLDPAIHLHVDTTAVVVSYCDVEGGWAGTGNIDEPPLFEDEAYNLSSESPCVDAGDPDPAYDDECFPPSQGTECNDMGAYGGPLACQWPAGEPSAVEEEYWGDRRDVLEQGLRGPFIQIPTVTAGRALRLAFGVRSDLGGIGPEGSLVGERGAVRFAVQLDLLDPSGRLERSLYAGFLGYESREILLGTQGLGTGLHFVRLSTPLGTCSRRVVIVR